MDTLTAVAVTTSACAIGLDVLLLYRQMHIAPWDHESPEPDVEAPKEETETSTAVFAAEPLVQAGTTDEIAPLNPAAAVSSYGSLPIEKATANVQTPTSTNSLEWPPPDAPRWFLGLKRSQMFLSPAERPPIFSRWYHVFKLLWPMLIVQEFLTPRPHPDQPKWHPQKDTSSWLFVLSTAKVVLALLVSVSITSKDTPPSGVLMVVASIEGWLAIAVFICSPSIYWKSKGWGKLSGLYMGRLRMALFAAIGIGIWVAVWTKRSWDWKLFSYQGLPMAMLVGMSYGIAWERWV